MSLQIAIKADVRYKMERTDLALISHFRNSVDGEMK